VLSKKSRGWYGRGWGQWGEMNQALYAHMNNKRKMKKKKKEIYHLSHCSPKVF
jgi:hypothetical protein